MSMTFSSIAVRSSLEALIAMIPEVWPEYAIVERSQPLASFEELYAWCDTRSQYLSGPAPYDAKGLYSVDDWSVILDFSMMFGDDQDALIELSARFGHVIAAATQGTAGFAGFGSYLNGVLRREIVAVDGSVETNGEPLPQEAGIDIGNFYVDEVERLWCAHELPSFLGAPSYRTVYVGLKLEDEADDSDPDA